MSAATAVPAAQNSVFKEPHIPFHQRRPVAVRSLGLFAKMLGHSMGIEVVFDPTVKTAATDNVKIYLPVLNDSGTQEDVDLLTGLVCHEGAHTAHTDFTIPLGGEGCTSELLSDLHNRFEDIWIEKKQAESYPGVPNKISRAIQIMTKRGTAFVKPDTSKEMHPASAVAGLIMCGLRTLYLGQEALKDHFPIWRREATKVLGDKMVRAIWAEACKVRTATHTAHALVIAKAVYDLLKDQADNKDPPPPPTPGIGDEEPDQNPQGQDQGQPGQGSGPGQDDPNAPPGKPGKSGSGKGSGKPDPKAKPQPGQPGFEPTPQQKKAAAQAVLNATKKDLGKSEFAEQIEKALEETGAKPTGGYGAGTGRNDIHQRIRDEASTDTIIERARPIAVRLGNDLEVLLEAKTDTDIRWSSEGRKIDPSRLSRVAVGNFGVFKHKDDREGLNTALQIATDISGSMDNWSGSFGRRANDGQSPLEVAEVATWTVLQACDRFEGVKTAAGAFGTSVHPVKRFDESFRGASAFLWNRGRDSGGTDTHWAANFFGRELLMRDEERKLFMLITDGIPSRVQDTAAALGEILRAGGEVAVLFIANNEQVYSPLKTAMAGSGATFAAVSSSEQLLTGIFESIRSSV